MPTNSKIKTVYPAPTFWERLSDSTWQRVVKIDGYEVCTLDVLNDSNELTEIEFYLLFTLPLGQRLVLGHSIIERIK